MKKFMCFLAIICVSGCSFNPGEWNISINTNNLPETRESKLNMPNTNNEQNVPAASSVDKGPSPSPAPKKSADPDSPATPEKSADPSPPPAAGESAAPSPPPAAGESAAPSPSPKPTTVPPPPLSDEAFGKLSNKLVGWGFKRNPGGRPEFTAGQIGTMESYNCIYIGNKQDKAMYLTFDEGYENGYTPKILDVLKEQNVPAAFFITGPYLEKEEALVRRMLNEGHIVGNHTKNHPSLPEVKDLAKLEEEVLSLDRMFYGVFKKHMKYIRPPKGEYSDRTLAVCNSLGYTSAFWSFAYVDWDTDNQKGADYAYNKVTSEFHNGAVILLHAVSSDNTDALERIIKTARERGYEWKALDEYK